MRSGARLFLGRRLPGVLGSLAWWGGSGYWSRGRSLPRRGLYAALTGGTLSVLARGPGTVGPSKLRVVLSREDLRYLCSSHPPVSRPKRFSGMYAGG